MDSLDASPLETTKSCEERISARLRRSCELCRASKGKCIASKEDIRKCQKCLKERKQCVFLEAKPRPKRAKNSRTRVAEMEQRLDRLYSLLSSATKGSTEKEALTPHSPPPPSFPVRIEAPPQPTADFAELLAANATPGASGECPPFFSHQPIWSAPHLIFGEIEDVISKGIVNFPEAEESLRLFKAKAVNFPFVLVPPHMSLDFMRREKPFLLLTILTLGAQETFKLQRTLEVEIREQLSRKAVVNGEKSLDLLQGILIYLCWYQFYFKPERQQVYQLSQMVASMAVDLGINQPPQNPSQQTNFTILNATPQVFNRRRMPEWINASRTVPEEVESRRTFLGCYWLSSSIALGLRKPTTLKHTKYVEECAQLLAQVADAETDHLLPHFIALQKFAEDVNLAFDYNGALQHPHVDSTRAEVLSKIFAQQLDQLHSLIPHDVWNNVHLSMSYHFLRIYIAEVGFHASPPSQLELMSGQSSPNAWYFSSARSESLIACLQASKNYLNRFIELTPRQTIDFILPDYLRLVYAVLILGRFVTRCDSPVLDASYVRKTANMGYYLEKLIGRANDLIMLSPDGDVKDTFYHMRKLWEQIKEWFDEITIDPACARECELGHPALNFMDILPSSIGKCVDVSRTIGTCDERWTDMLDLDLTSCALLGLENILA